MYFDEIVTIGEIMEMKVGDVCTRTKLQDVLDNQAFTVFHPTVKGIPVPMQHGDVITMSFYRSNGVFSFDAKVTSWYVKDQIKFCQLQALTEVTKTQRRKSFRLPIVLNVVLRQLDGDEDQQAKRYKAKTVDLSEHGMLLSCFQCFPPGTPIIAEVKMPDKERREFKTEVLRCETPTHDTDPHNMVLLFLNCTEFDRAYLRRFILRQQIIARKKREPGK